MVSWDPASGIETGPGGDFYQIELVQISDEFLIYGASSIYQTSHLMPFNSFMPGSAGFPEGNDFGRGLGAFEDGSYYFEVMSFQVGNADAGEFGNECQIRTSDERIFLEKVEGTFTLDP